MFILKQLVKENRTQWCDSLCTKVCNNILSIPWCYENTFLLICQIPELWCITWIHKLGQKSFHSNAFRLTFVLIVTAVAVITNGCNLSKFPMLHIWCGQRLWNSIFFHLINQNKCALWRWQAISKTTYFCRISFSVWKIE